MLVSNLRLQIAFVIYIVLVALVLILKPSFFYDEDGNLKYFGTGKKNSTIMPLWLVIFLTAIVSYYCGFILEQLVKRY